MDEEKKMEEKKFISRRDFIKGMGSGVVATTAISTGATMWEKAHAHNIVPEKLDEPGKSIITLIVNGVKYSIQIRNHWTLAEILRGELGLTGTKISCNRGECGACTVIMDGKLIYSCTKLAATANGKEILTIEGLTDGERLHPIQQSFIDHDAFQCGFCTSGQIMAAKAFLDKNLNPTIEEVKKAFSGNLCRCGTYPNIFKATMAAAKTLAKEKGGQ